MSVKESGSTKPPFTVSSKASVVCLLGKSPRDAYLICKLKLTDNSHNGVSPLNGPWHRGSAAAELRTLVRLGAAKQHSGGAVIPSEKS
jgi:hypothetical protein